MFGQRQSPWLCVVIIESALTVSSIGVSRSNLVAAIHGQIEIIVCLQKTEMKPVFVVANLYSKTGYYL